jgi:hypothetical protein
LAFIVLVLLNWRRFNSIKSAMSEGAINSVLPILNTASLVGFGTVIAALQGFADVRDIILGVFPENPLISLAIAVNALTGITVWRYEHCVGNTGPHLPEAGKCRPYQSGSFAQDYCDLNRRVGRPAPHWRGRHLAVDMWVNAQRVLF